MSKHNSDEITMNNTLGITSHEEHTNPGGKKKHPAIHIRHNIKDHTIYIKYEYTHIKKQKQTNKKQTCKWNFFYLMTHSTNFIYGYMAWDIW